MPLSVQKFSTFDFLKQSCSQANAKPTVKRTSKYLSSAVQYSVKSIDYQHNVEHNDTSVIGLQIRLTFVVFVTCIIITLHRGQINIVLPCQDHSHCQDFDVNDLLSELPARSGVELIR